MSDSYLEDVQDTAEGYAVDYGGELVEACPACGNAPDYCPGHGPVGDPAGYALLVEAGRAEPEEDETEDDGLRTCGGCGGCGHPIDQADDGTWFVYGTDTSADGLTYCPPNPDHDEEQDGELGWHEPEVG